MTIRNNPILASFFVWDKDLLESDSALHVIMKHDQRLLDLVIQSGKSVKTVEEFRKIPFKYPFPSHATFPGPLFRAVIYYVEELKSCAFVFNGNLIPGICLRF
jgi:hypothetical protein